MCKYRNEKAYLLKVTNQTVKGVKRVKRESVKRVNVSIPWTYVINDPIVE